MARGAAFVLSLLCLLLAAAATSAADDRPRRIASFNLCADQLVVALADAEQIVGLSPYAADPALSVVAQKARDFPILDWQAETAVVLKPDLVLVGPIDRTATRRMLAQLGFRVAEVALVTDFAAARSQIHDIAALVGHPERGERMVAELDAALARLRAAALKPTATALVIERGGYASGPQSLVAALLAEAGLRPPTGAPGGFGGYLPLELLITHAPRLPCVEGPAVPRHRSGRAVSDSSRARRALSAGAADCIAEPSYVVRRTGAGRRAQ